jgi:nucleoside triphosphate pyrophosphatase
MDHVLLPQGQEGDICFVVTADTLTENKFGEIEGKPINCDDAIKKLKHARNGVRTGTAFCLDRRLYKDDKWCIDVRIRQFVDATYCFNVPDNLIDFYLENVPVVGSCAIAIEGFGGQFLKSITGSYTAVVGLPMYELREALCTLGFFS